jgi:hypothetical protein
LNGNDEEIEGTHLVVLEPVHALTEENLVGSAKYDRESFLPGRDHVFRDFGQLGFDRLRFAETNAKLCVQVTRKFLVGQVCCHI